MNLEFVKTTVCPVCGCDVIVEERVETEINSPKVRVHACGGKWEYRKFACGYETHYCPNYFKEYTFKKCSVDPEKLERERKRVDAKESILTAISNLDVDSKFKNDLAQRIKYM